MLSHRQYLSSVRAEVKLTLGTSVYPQPYTRGMTSATFVPECNDSNTTNKSVRDSMVVVARKIILGVAGYVYVFEKEEKMYAIIHLRRQKKCG